MGYNYLSLVPQYCQNMKQEKSRRLVSELKRVNNGKMLFQ